MKTAPSGKYFKLGNWKLARSADLKGLGSTNNKDILIESSVRKSSGFDRSKESNQDTTVLTFRVLE